MTIEQNLKDKEKADSQSFVKEKHILSPLSDYQCSNIRTLADTICSRDGLGSSK